MELILSIEDYEGYEPNGKNVEDVLPMFTLLYGWAFSNQLLSSGLFKEPYFSEFQKVQSGALSLKEFAIKLLDGKITKDMFKEPWIGEYVSDYIETGTYSYELEDFFGVDSIFKIPENWNECAKFIEELNKSFKTASENYH